MGKRIPTRPFEPIRESYLDQLLSRRGRKPPDLMLRDASRRLEALIQSRPLFSVTICTAAAFALGSLLARTRAAGGIAAALGGIAVLAFLRGPGRSEVDRIRAIAEPDHGLNEE